MKKYYVLLITAILLIFGVLGFYNDQHTFTPEKEAQYIKSMNTIEKYYNDQSK